MAGRAFDPGELAHVGAESPTSAAPSQVNSVVRWRRKIGATISPPPGHAADLIRSVLYIVAGFVVIWGGLQEAKNT